MSKPSAKKKVARKRIKKSDKKISGKTEKQVPQAPEQLDVNKLSDIKIARLIQEQLLKVISHKNEIEACQRNVWQFNGILDEREATNEKRKKKDEPTGKK